MQITIISRDVDSDRMSAAIDTVLALPQAEFDFFMQSVLKSPEQTLAAHFETDFKIKNVQRDVHIGVAEFAPNDERWSYATNGEHERLLTFVSDLKRKAKFQHLTERQEQLDRTLNPRDLFIAYYVQTAEIDVLSATHLWELLENPQALNEMVLSKKDAETIKHVGKICDSRMPNRKTLIGVLGVERMAALSQNYAYLKQQGVNFDLYINPYYRFQEFKSEFDVEPTIARIYQDKKDFQINPKLLKELDLASCQETTPERRAIWLYTRLCDVLKYDEGYFYSQNRKHPNDDPYASFDIVEQVTADTPTTCFNFSRVAVKLLNQIEGVHASIIASGTNLGHFRFGFYTDQISVDAEPTRAINGYNDMSRVKLGIPPVRLNAIYGKELVQQIINETVEPMLAVNKKSVREYMQVLQTISADTKHEQINVKALLSEFKANGIDGATTLQVLYAMNHQFAQKPYDLARAGKVADDGVLPQLVLREGDQFSQIDLTNLSIKPLAQQDLNTEFAREKMVGVDSYYHDDRKRLTTVLFKDNANAQKNDAGEMER